MLIVSRTGCGKTTFIQKLEQNKMFGKDITQVFWISKILLTSEREDAIRGCFVDQNVQFVYPNNIDDFNYLIDSFMAEKAQPEPENNLGELLIICRWTPLTSKNRPENDYKRQCICQIRHKKMRVVRPVFQICLFYTS